MDGFLARFFLNSNDHLSEEQTVQWICRELPFAEKLIADRHLARCWQCRLRKDDLEGRRADNVMGLYRAHISSEAPQLTARPREMFIERLRLQMQAYAPSVSWWTRVTQMPLLILSPLSHPRATGLVLGIAGIVSFGLWWQQRVPQITSNSLLVRAERWDTSSLSASDGVVFQAVRITTGGQTIQRSIYRDPQGRRRARPLKLAAQENQLRMSLIGAGLDWDEPISASGYQGWHDHQRVREDKIVRAGKHLLKLTTTVPEGAVSEQSLTVRDTDFHAVDRTVAFRNQGTVEIAELEFKILPWSAVDTNVFEPLGGDQPMPTLALVHPGLVSHLPEMLSDTALDEAELSARLILNQLHADTGEQIEIDRTPEGVEVKGLVETGERKRELQTQLRIVPHLKVSIESVTDLKDAPPNGETVGEAATSMPDQPSPLNLYLRSLGQDVGAVNALARNLFNSALTISQESRAIGDLQTRFDPGKQSTVMASATSLQLIYSHRERLIAALGIEREMLAQVPGHRYDETETSPGEVSIQNLAAKNLDLCKELTQTSKVATRGAVEIVAELSTVTVSLDRAIREMNAKPKDLPTSNGKQ